MTQSDLTVAALPIDIAFADRESNLAAARSMARELKAPAHILVLPELFSTGYVNDPEAMHKLAEDNSGPTMQAVRAIAASTHAPWQGLLWRETTTECATGHSS